MQKGYLAISSILIISAVVLAITVSVSYLAIGEGQASLGQSKGEDTLSFVEGCLEDGILKLRADGSYSGGSITRPEGTCTITISSVGTTYTVTATTTDTSYVRTVQSIINRDYSITMTSWNEQ